MNETFTAASSNDIHFTNRQLVQLILPLLFEQLLNITVGLADSMMVSTIGEASISAVSLVDSISNLMIYIFAALATGGAAVAGQYLGQGKQKDACDAGQQLIFLLASVSLALTFLLYAFRTFLLTHLFGHIDHDVMAATRTYYTIVMASIPAIALYNGGTALLRTMSRSDATLLISMLMNAANVLGNYILIFHFHFDVAGVAIPTLISRILAAVIALVLLCNKKQVLYLSAPSKFRVNRHLMRNITYIGIPSSIENGSFQLGRLILFSLISTFGTASIVANAVGNTIGNFHCFAGQAVSLGLTPVISQCIGANHFDKARYYMHKLSSVTYALMGSINILLILAIPLILQIYDLDAQSARLAGAVMFLHSSSAIILWVPAFMIPHFLRATGDAKYTMRVSMTTMWLIRVLLAYFLGKYMGYGVLGVWFAHSIADWSARSIIFFLRYRSGVWEKMAIKD